MARQPYLTIKKSATGELTEKRSRFIAYTKYAETEEEAQAFINKIKKKDHEASHHVYAYQLGENIDFQRSSDDGEPAGSGGRPVLEAIQKAAVKNTVIVVSRYFGGTLLGAGPLARTYGKTAALALQASARIRKIPAQQYSICFDYSYLGKVEAYLAAKNLTVYNKIYSLKAAFICLFPEDNEEKIISELGELSGDQISVMKLGEDDHIEVDVTE